LLEVLDGVYTVADDQQLSVIITFDLSATFDIVRHDILLQRLRDEFGITLTVLRVVLADDRHRKHKAIFAKVE